MTESFWLKDVTDLCVLAHFELIYKDRLTY